MKKVFALSFTLFCVLAFLTGCAFVDNLNNVGDEPSTTSEPETTVTAQEMQTPEPPASPNDDIETLIKSNIDVLAHDDPDAILDALDHELFTEIVALGEAALPSLEMIADRANEEVSWYPNLEFEHRIWAVHAIYAIKPETYDLFFPSPDGVYTARVIVDSFESFYNHVRSFNDIHIVENATSDIIYTTDMSDAFSIGGLFYPEINWSADSRFVVIDCCGRRSGSAMAIDMQSRSDLFLPGAEEAIYHVFPEEDAGSLLLVPRSWFQFEGWESEKIVKIEFYVSVLADDQDFSGWYTYDLTEKELLKLEHSFVS